MMVRLRPGLPGPLRTVSTSASGWPVSGLEFDPALVIRGLILDLDHGNILKVNRFGYVKRAYHGTHEMSYDEQRRLYGRELVDLARERYVFLNTLFSVSEASMYAQLVEHFDQAGIQGVLGYRDLYRQVRTSIDEAHLEGQLKAEIMADPADHQLRMGLYAHHDELCAGRRPSQGHDMGGPVRDQHCVGPETRVLQRAWPGLSRRE